MRKAVLVLVLLSGPLAGCMTSGCISVDLTADKALPVETWLDRNNIGAVHRIQGIYRSDFEFSTLTVDFDGDLRDLPTGFTLFDYCIGFADEVCYNEISRSTASRGYFLGKVAHFGFLDAVVRFDGPASLEEACPMGHITVLRLIQAGRIESPQRSPSQ
jgi:hypothetical protein